VKPFVSWAQENITRLSLPPLGPGDGIEKRSGDAADKSPEIYMTIRNISTRALFIRKRNTKIKH